MAIKKTTTKSTPAKKSSSVGISIFGGKAEQRKWEIESAMSTLKRAAEIQNDSKLMSDVKKMAMEQAKMFNNLANGKMK